MKTFRRIAKHAASERGDGVFLAVAALAITLLFAFFTLNATYYYTRKDRLELLARDIAAYAGSELPSPRGVFTKAQAAFNVLKGNLGASHAGQSELPAGLTLHVLIEHYDPASSSYVKTEFNPAANPAQTLSAPIRSAEVRISAPYTLSWYSPSNLPESNMGTLTLTATAEVSLVPTDVVLVVENSNSLITPVANESTLTTIPPFSSWTGELLGPAAAQYGGSFSAIRKDLMMTRGCFGEGGEKVKRAALELYDLLSAAAMFRVTILPTLHMNGDTSAGYPEIGVSSERTALAAALPLAAAYEYGRGGPAISRCAALTQLTPFGVPGYGLAAEGIDVSGIRTNLAPLMRCSGLPNPALCPGDSHLEFNSSLAPKLSPREALWITPLGAMNGAGLPDAKMSYQYAQLSILRAIDLLRDAPKRSDNVAVKRRVVLLLTDGFEQPFAFEDKGKPYFEDRGLVRADAGIQLGGASFTTQRVSLGGEEGKTPAMLGHFDHYCVPSGTGASGPNEIESETRVSAADVTANGDGIKLGVLYYGFREQHFQSMPPDDPLARSAGLPGHHLTDAPTFRTECNSKWSTERGRFLIEVSPETPGGLPADFPGSVAPSVARALFVSDIIQ